MGGHRAVGRLKGSVGGWVLDRAFDAHGAEALSPAVDQRGFAAFLYEEVTWPHVTFQFGGRVDRTNLSPAGEADRDFTNRVGLGRPAASAGRGQRSADGCASAWRAPRAHPALEELFFFGPHPGNFAFEVGNPDLESGARARARRVAAVAHAPRVWARSPTSATASRNFIFASPLTEEEFEAREEEFEARFPGRELEPRGPGHGGRSRVEFVEYVGADSVLQGVEAHADFQSRRAWPPRSASTTCGAR